MNTGNGWINAKDCGASGSEFQSVGAIRAGSDRLAVQDAGDFMVGQRVTISGCNVHHYGTVYSAAHPARGKNIKPLQGEAELRGLAHGKPWQVFVVHFEKTDPVTFSWMAVDSAFQPESDKERWTWQEKSLPINSDWVTLADGVQMRFRKFDWLPGQCISFHARNRLVARITGIEGNTLILNERAGQDAHDAVVRHLDQEPLQAAIDRAIAERKGLFIPSGRYRLTAGLWIRNASLRIEGAHRDQTVLDISEDNTAVFWIAGGQDVAVRNLSMIGHTGFNDLPCAPFYTASGHDFWPTANQQMEVKGCAAANIVSTEHLLFEDLKVARMASEAFYLHGSDRFGSPPYVQAPHDGMPGLQKQYTKSCVYHRCHVSDCNFNAFNNNDFAENTSILHCRVERVKNFCEQASRFTRIIGNYIGGARFNGTVHTGGARRENFLRLGSSQAIISDNVFEEGTGDQVYNGFYVFGGATQVVVANNIFVNFGQVPAISISDETPAGGFPARFVVVSGNIIDLTHVGDVAEDDRAGISVAASNVIIADNQIYARGTRSEKTTGIQIADHCVNLHLHDNLIQNCGSGLRTGLRLYEARGDKGGHVFIYRHTESEIAETAGPRMFRDKNLPCTWESKGGYEGWRLRWLSGPNAGKTSTIAGYDPQKRTIILKDEISLQAGDRFAVCPHYANWQIHHNTITECARPLLFDLLGGDHIAVKDNFISPPE